MKKIMCKPCSLGVAAEGKKVKQAVGRWEKITCEVCGRRRFGAVFEVTDKEGGKTHEGV